MKAGEYSPIEKAAIKWLDETDTMQFSQMELLAMFAESQNKELIEKIEDLKAQLNDDGEIPFVDPPVKTTKYRLSRIVEGSDHSGENMTDKNQ